MEYYVTMLTSFVIMLIILKVAFSEFEGRSAKKNSNFRYFLNYQGSFNYHRTNMIIVMSVFCYLVASLEEILSMMWVLQLLGFVACGVIADGLSQVLAHYFMKIRFGKNINEAVALKQEVDAIAGDYEDAMVEETRCNYDSKEIAKRYFDNDSHLAFISVDGGEFISNFETLPPITYVVEGNANKAHETLGDKEVKITTLTKEGRLPFKDDKIDLIVNELANYDKFEFYRTLKPGGYVMVDQLGSDNYKEIISMFMPFRIKGSWDQEACATTLSDIGFDIVDKFEDKGHIRFKSLEAIFAFMKQIAPDRVDKYELFINFYAKALKQIKENSFFDLTTHRFMVIARKKEM